METQDLKFEEKYNSDIHKLYVYGYEGSPSRIEIEHYSNDIYDGFSEVVAKEIITHKNSICVVNKQLFREEATTLAELFPSIQRAFKEVEAKIQEDKRLLNSDLSAEAKDHIIERFTSEAIYDCYMELEHPDVPQSLIFRSLEIFSVIVPIKVIEIPRSRCYVFLNYIDSNGKYAYIVLSRGAFFKD